MDKNLYGISNVSTLQFMIIKSFCL